MNNKSRFGVQFLMDIVDYTAWMSENSLEQVKLVLDALYFKLDVLSVKYNVSGIQTEGDSFSGIILFDASSEIDIMMNGKASVAVANTLSLVMDFLIFLRHDPLIKLHGIKYKSCIQIVAIVDLGGNEDHETEAAAKWLFGDHIGFIQYIGDKNDLTGISVYELLESCPAGAIHFSEIVESILSTAPHELLPKVSQFAIQKAAAAFNGGRPTYLIEFSNNNAEEYLSSDIQSMLRLLWLAKDFLEHWIVNILISFKRS